MHAYLRTQILKMRPLNNISEYILEKECFHMIFLGKDLPAEAGIKSIFKWMPGKSLCCVSYSREKKQLLEVRPLNDVSELILESDPLDLIIVGMYFSTVGDLKVISKCVTARDLRRLSYLRKTGT